MATAPKQASPGNYENCPEGPQTLVCCDYIDLGMQPANFGGKPKMQHKVRILWQSQHLRTDGKPHIVGRRFTFSMLPSASLRKFLAAWRGRAFSDQEAMDFDFDNLIGANGYGQVSWSTSSRGTYADVMSMMPLPPGFPKLQVRDYVRVAARTPEQQAAPGQDYHQTASAPAQPPAQHTPPQQARPPQPQAPATPPGGFGGFEDAFAPKTSSAPTAPPPAAAPAAPQQSIVPPPLRDEDLPF